MRNATFALLAICATGFLVTSAIAQERLDPEHPAMSIFSPFAQMVDQMIAPPKSQAVLPFICPIFAYYNTTSTPITYSQSLPTSKWAFRFTPPGSANVYAPCTVWVVQTDFELNNAASSDRDTIQYFIREVASPYTQIFTTHFLARPGHNYGEIEIDPPPVPPFNVRSITLNKRELYIGYYVRGNAAHTAEFKFTAPSNFTNPVRSVAFSTNTSFVPASSIVGQSVDWVAYARVCCKYTDPVELALFRAELHDGAVKLDWRTESETNNFGFEVQRAWTAEGPWETRGVVAGNGTTTRPCWYSYRDALSAADIPAGADIAWYRLRQTDFDGTVEDVPPVRVYMAGPEHPSFRLHSAFPNPASIASGDIVYIRYELDAASAIRIAVHDALGREVALLAEGDRAAGLHETVWNPAAGLEGLRTGAFFVRMTGDGRMATRQVTLVR